MAMVPNVARSPLKNPKNGTMSRMLAETGNASRAPDPGGNRVERVGRPEQFEATDVPGGHPFTDVSGDSQIAEPGSQRYGDWKKAVPRRARAMMPTTDATSATQPSIQAGRTRKAPASPTIPARQGGSPRRVGHDFEVVLGEVHGSQREQRKKQKRDHVSHDVGDPTPERAQRLVTSALLSDIQLPAKFVTKLTLELLSQLLPNLPSDADRQVLQLLKAQIEIRSRWVDH